MKTFFEKQKSYLASSSQFSITFLIYIFVKKNYATLIVSYESKLQLNIPWIKYFRKAFRKINYYSNHEQTDIVYFLQFL